jgi:hypothetical protein
MKSRVEQIESYLTKASSMLEDGETIIFSRAATPDDIEKAVGKPTNLDIVWIGGRAYETTDRIHFKPCGYVAPWARK